MNFDAIQLFKTLSRLACLRQGVHVMAKVGSPMYFSCTRVIPNTEVLFGKDAPSGTIHVPMMSIAAIFRPEMIVPCKVIKTSLITPSAGFLFVAVGYLINWLVV